MLTRQKLGPERQGLRQTLLSEQAVQLFLRRERALPASSDLNG